MFWNEGSERVIFVWSKQMTPKSRPKKTRPNPNPDRKKKADPDRKKKVDPDLRKTRPNPNPDRKKKVYPDLRKTRPNPFNPGNPMNPDPVL
jgi:hypothetical protein